MRAPRFRRRLSGWESADVVHMDAAATQRPVRVTLIMSRRRRRREDEGDGPPAKIPRIEVAQAAVARFAPDQEIPDEVLEHEVMPNVDSPVDLAAIGLTSRRMVAAYHRVLWKLYERHFRSPLTGRPYSVAVHIRAEVWPMNPVEAYALMNRVVRQTLRACIPFQRHARHINALATSLLMRPRLDPPVRDFLFFVDVWKRMAVRTTRRPGEDIWETIVQHGAGPHPLALSGNVTGLLVVDLEPLWRLEGEPMFLHLNTVDEDVAAVITATTGQPTVFATRPVAPRDADAPRVYYTDRL